MKKKDALLILIVLLLVGIVKIVQHRSKVRADDPDLSQTYYEHVDSANQFAFAPEEYRGVTRLVLDNKAGSLSFLPSDDDTLTVQSTLVVFHPSESVVDDLHGRIRVDAHLDESGTLALQVIGFQENDEGRFLVDHAVWLPRKVPLDAGTRYGRIELAHVEAAVRLRHQAGEVHVSALTGNLELDVTQSQVVIMDVNGEQQIQARKSDLTLQGCRGVSITPKRSQLTFTDMRGPVTVNQGLLSRITVDKAQRVQIQGSGDRISLKHIADGVVINDEFEDISLEQIAGDVSVESKRSELTMTGLEGKSLFVRNSFRDTLLVQSRFETTRIELHQSNLEMDLLEPGTGVEIEGYQSDVTLFVPEALVFSANFVTKMGEILQTVEDASLILQKDRSHSRMSRKSEGAPLVRISTSYGNITLEPLKTR